MSFANLLTQLCLFSLFYVLVNTYMFVHPPTSHARSPLHAAANPLLQACFCTPAKNKRKVRKQAGRKAKGTSLSLHLASMYHGTKTLNCYSAALNCQAAPTTVARHLLLMICEGGQLSHKDFPLSSHCKEHVISEAV